MWRQRRDPNIMTGNLEHVYSTHAPTYSQTTFKTLCTVSVLFTSLHGMDSLHNYTKNFPTFSGIQRFIRVLRRPHYLALYEPLLTSSHHIYSLFFKSKISSHYTASLLYLTTTVCYFLPPVHHACRRSAE